MNNFFFSGSHSARLDDKNRFVLPQTMRYGLVEKGVLEFSIGLSQGGCLAIYRKSDIEKIVEAFSMKQHVARYQKFFTIFFSTLYHTECDKVGRVTVPAHLKRVIQLDQEVVVAGVLNRIEIWPAKIYEATLRAIFEDKETGLALAQMTEEVFSLLDQDDKETNTCHQMETDNLISLSS